MKSGQKAFTLIELLVVIAIIGVLSSVVVASLNNSRVKAKISAAQATMNAISSAMMVCRTEGSSVVVVPTSDSNTNGLADLCSPSLSAAKYSALPVGWNYCDTVASGNCATKVSASVTDDGFSIVAYGDGITITCTISGCVKS